MIADQLNKELKEYQKRQKKSHKKAQTATSLLLLALLLVIFFLIGGSLWYLRNQPAGVGGGIIQFDDSAQNGNLPRKSDADIQRALNEIVEQGMFNISIASEVYFEKGTSEGMVRIENIPANHYYMKVAITLDETGENLYESGAIKPGQYIESIILKKRLDKGRYEATAVFTALDQKTLEEVGNAAAKITVIVEG